MKLTKYLGTLTLALASCAMPTANKPMQVAQQHHDQAPPFIMYDQARAASGVAAVRIVGETNGQGVHQLTESARIATVRDGVTMEDLLQHTDGKYLQKFKPDYSITTSWTVKDQHEVRHEVSVDINGDGESDYHFDGYLPLSDLGRETHHKISVDSFGKGANGSWYALMFEDSEYTEMVLIDSDDDGDGDLVISSSFKLVEDYQNIKSSFEIDQLDREEVFYYNDFVYVPTLNMFEGDRGVNGVASRNMLTMGGADDQTLSHVLKRNRSKRVRKRLKKAESKNE